MFFFGAFVSQNMESMGRGWYITCCILGKTWSCTAATAMCCQRAKWISVAPQRNAPTGKQQGAPPWNAWFSLQLLLLHVVATSFWLKHTSRVAKVLFGHCLGHSSFANCVFNKMTVLSRHRLHKDFPEPGDSSYFAFEGVWILRRLPDSHSCFRSVFVFSTPEDKWASWASSLFPAYAIMFHRGVDRVLNGPMFKELRPIDAKLYSVLALKSFNRGHPLVPQGSESDPSADTVTVSAGEHLGLVSWTCFNPHRKFFLAEYLQSFMAALGLELKTFKVMDGRKLVKYQCVVVRQEWNQVRALFFEAFKVQKAAYRRANGGTSNPSLVEDVAPHFVSCDFTYNRCSQVIKTVVRKTFLELDEASESQLKRSISTGEMPYEVSVLWTRAKAVQSWWCKVCLSSVQRGIEVPFFGS